MAGQTTLAPSWQHTIDDGKFWWIWMCEKHDAIGPARWQICQKDDERKEDILGACNCMLLVPWKSVLVMVNFVKTAPSMHVSCAVLVTVTNG